MILHGRPIRRLNAVTKWAFVLAGLAVLPLSATAQVATDPVRPTSEPSVATSAAQSVATEAVLEEAVPASPAKTALPSNKAAPAVEAAPSSFAYSDGAAQDGTERRLQRLEKMVESILAEMKNQRTVSSSSGLPRSAGSDLSRATYGLLSARKTANAVEDSPSLSDLKKQRIDIEDQLDNLRERLADIDEQIVKLQTNRPAKRNAAENYQPK